MTQDNNSTKNSVLDICKNYLDFAAIGVIIICVALILINLIMYTLIDNTKKDNGKNVKQIIIKLEVSKKLKNNGDSLHIANYQTIVDSLNHNIKTLNKIQSDIEIKEKRKEDDARFNVAIIAIIFTCVGFFGFKSIFDTRQAAIDKAVAEAKEKAQEIAKTEARDVAKMEAQNIAQLEATEVAKRETINYLDDNLQNNHLKKIEETIFEGLKQSISSIESDIDDIKNAYKISENNRPESIKEIDNKFTKIVDKINLVEKEIFDIKKDSLENLIFERLKNKVDGNA